MTPAISGMIDTRGQMKTDIRLLTRREGKKTHHETVLTIDWSGVTEEQLRTLAQWAIVHEVQARFFKGEQEPPETHLVKVAELAREQPTLNLKWCPPPPKIKFSKEFADLLAGLTPEEKEKLEGMLA